MRVWVFLLALLLGAQVAARGQEAEPRPGAANDERLAGILERVSEAAERYNKGMFGIAFTEALRHEELKKDLTPKRSKEYVFDSVVLREQLSADESDYYPRTVRRLKTVDGKPAKAGDAGERIGFYVAPLYFLLPQRIKSLHFTLEGEERLGGRSAYRLHMEWPGQGEPKVEWEGMRFLVSAPMALSIWVDAESFDVLRIESHLVAPFEFESPRSFNVGPFGRIGPTRRLRYAREDYTVSFRRAQFKDPEQSLLVPESAEWVSVIDGAKWARVRATLRFADYRRFRSDVKVIEEPNE